MSLGTAQNRGLVLNGPALATCQPSSPSAEQNLDFEKEIELLTQVAIERPLQKPRLCLEPGKAQLTVPASGSLVSSARVCIHLYISHLRAGKRS